MQRGPRREARKWIYGCKRAASRIIPPRAEVLQRAKLQLAGEAEGVGGGAALRQAEGGVGEGGGQQGDSDVSGMKFYNTPVW